MHAPDGPWQRGCGNTPCRVEKNTAVGTADRERKIQRPGGASARFSDGQREQKTPPPRGFSFCRLEETPTLRALQNLKASPSESRSMLSTALKRSHSTRMLTFLVTFNAIPAPKDTSASSASPENGTPPVVSRALDSQPKSPIFPNNSKLGLSGRMPTAEAFTPQVSTEPLVTARRPNAPL